MAFVETTLPDAIPAIPHWRISALDRSRPHDTDHEWSAAWSDGEGLHVSTAKSGPHEIFRLNFDRGGTFDVDPGQRRITAFSHSSEILPSTVSLLLADQVAPRILAHEGELVVHGSAIDAGGAAVIFIGESGIGKSTLAASFGQSGISVICDDAMHIDAAGGSPTARALCPNLRLHPDSLEALYPAIPAHSTTAHHGLKRRLTDPQLSHRNGGALPIAAIFAIEPERARQEIELKPMSSAQLCMALVSNSFSLNPADLELAGERLRKVGLIADKMPAFSLAYPRNFGLLPRVRAAVLDAARTGKGD